MQIVTFDFHNTLARCDPWFHLEIRDLATAVLRQLADRKRLPVNADQFAAATSAYRRLRQRVVSSGVELDALASVLTVFDELAIDADQDEVARIIDDEMRAALAEVEPVAGAVETVRHLSDADVPLAVISSAVYHPFLEWTIERFGLSGHFQTVVTSASSGYYKSHRGIYEAALRATRAHPERSVHIGDSLRWDVAGAQSVGMHTIWYQTDHRDSFTAGAQTTGPAPDLTLTTLIDAAPTMLDYLRSIA